MKLSHQQIEAISSTIVRNIKLKIEEHNKKVDKLTEEFVNRKLSLKGNLTLKEYHESVGKMSYSINSVPTFVQNKYKEEFEKIPKRINSRETGAVRDKVIIASMEAKGIEELIDTITKEFLP